MNQFDDISNDDWEVTEAIYGNSVVGAGVIDINISLHCVIGIRRVNEISSVTETDSPIASTFEYCILEESFETPKCRVSFHYSNGEIPDSFELEMICYPDSWPQEEEKKWLDWLKKNIKEELIEQTNSFSVCRFIEYQALQYFNVIHTDEVHGYSAILFPEDERSHGLSWQNSKKVNTIYKNDVRGLTPGISLDDYAIQIIQRHWKEWGVLYECPICFESGKASNGIELPCRHFFCEDCISKYVKTKIEELGMFRYSPFTCPIVSCRKGMKIQSGNYPISNADKAAIKAWKFNINYPKTTMLSQCIRKACKSTNVRRASSQLSETVVFCRTCEKSFCELCLHQYGCMIYPHQHQHHECKEPKILKLCRLYRHASDEIKQKADEKWHWLKDYASAREEDISAKLWITENASQCPTCKIAIERISGCFHIHCDQCGTHFCYECGTEIFYPFYGTHHCWENGFDYDD